MDKWDSLVAQKVKSLLAMQETWVWLLGWDDPLGNGNPLQKISSMEEGFQRVRHDWATSLSLKKDSQTWTHPHETYIPEEKGERISK